MANKKPFNDAFSGLKALKKEEPKKAVPTRPPPRASERSNKPSEPADENELFRQAMGEVQAVKAGPKVVMADPAVRLADKRKHVNEEEEAMMRLSELVANEGPVRLSDGSSERVEGAVDGLDPRILRRLQSGDYPVSAQLDLHGLTLSEAKTEFDRFLHDSRMKGRRCVLVVHGRGLHSEGEVPVLKDGVVSWLMKGRMAKAVLAFCSAQPSDGGAGAMYILMRQR